HVPGDAAWRQFTKVVVHSVHALGEVDAGDHFARVVGRTASATGGIQTVVPAVRLIDLPHTIGAGREVLELVIPVGVCRGVDAQPTTVGIEQFQRHVSQARLVTILDAVVVQFAIDVAGQASRRQFAKVVVGAVLPANQRDTRDAVAGIVGRTASIAHGFHAVVPAIRLSHLPHTVGTGREVLEPVETVGVCRGVDAQPDAVGIEQFQRNALQARLAAFHHAVVVHIAVDVAGQASRRQLAKVVVGGILARSQRYGGDLVARVVGSAAGTAGAIQAVVPAVRLID